MKKLFHAVNKFLRDKFFVLRVFYVILFWAEYD